jgi:dolichol-phosphate mannosyltransferase
MSAEPSLTLILFAFNESENVRPVIFELCQWLDANEPDAEIVFVDDGSRDDTADVARSALAGRRAIVKRHETNRGIGAALKTGVAAATAPWVTFMPADGQIEPDAIGVLRNAARDGQAEVVFSVYDDRNDGLDRKVLSFGIRALIRLVHGVRMRSDGPYLFKRALFVPEVLKPDTFFLNFEFPIRMLVQGIVTRTVTVRCRPRIAGFSKSTGLKRIWGVGKDLVDLRIRRWMGQ